MAKYELKLPSMGEGVVEATITNWLKNVGEEVEEDEPVLEIATDKVDSEIPSEVDGVLKEILFEADDAVKVGETVALIEVEGAETGEEEIAEEPSEEDIAAVEQTVEKAQSAGSSENNYTDASRFYSPLVKSIAEEENITLKELEEIEGTGKDNRLTKNDILAYVDRQGQGKDQKRGEAQTEPVKSAPDSNPSNIPVRVGEEDEIIEMSRMGKLIANHMVSSKRTSAHVQSFTEVDVTKVWNWRNTIKKAFQKREGEKLTFTPIFMAAVAKAINDFPMINISVEGDKVIKHNHINLGMATALPDDNLIVPVIRDADTLNLLGMAKKVNQLADQARTGKLSPDATTGGTYTVTNIGAFGSIMGTPIINQPQVAILALGTIRKVPAVIATPQGDTIGIRYKMILSHSYDHRVVNGALGSRFVERVKAYLEDFDDTQTV